MKSATALLLPLVVFALSAVSSARAAELEWHQERVAALAQDLVKHVEVIRADLESRPSVPETAAARAAVMNDIDRLDLRARELVKRLATGAGRGETTALFREVETLGNQAAEHSREYPAKFEVHVHIEQAQRITVELARYYGGS